MLKKSDSNVINDDTFSNRDEDLLETIEINHRLLNHFDYYLTTNTLEFITESLQSGVVANYIVEKLINEGSRLLYDKYIGTKMANHVLISSREYLDMLNGIEFQGHDLCELGMETLEEDPQPVRLIRYLKLMLKIG